MTQFYDMATDKCLSCEENKNISYDFCPGRYIKIQYLNFKAYF